MWTHIGTFSPVGNSLIQYERDGFSKQKPTKTVLTLSEYLTGVN